MSRFYEGDGDNPIGITWSGNIERILRGKRGQRVLRDLIDALLSLPERRLIANRMASPDGEVCAVACYARHKGIELPVQATELDSDQEETIALGERAGLGWMLSWELGSLNDLVFHKLIQYRRHILLDVPVEVESFRGWGGKWEPAYERHVMVSDGPLRGYTPEERWQEIYKWAATRVRWQPPALCS